MNISYGHDGFGIINCSEEGLIPWLQWSGVESGSYCLVFMPRTYPMVTVSGLGLRLEHVFFLGGGGDCPFNFIPSSL